MKRHLILLVGIVTLMWSCRDVLEIDIPFDGHQMVVHGFLQPDSSVFILILENRQILSGFEPFLHISDASVELFEEGKSMGFFQYDHSGWYGIGHKPQAGKTYSIEIDSEKHGLAKADAYIPPTMDPSNIKILDQLMMKDTSKSVVLEVSIDDPLDEVNYYEIALVATNNDKLYRNDTLIHEHSVMAPVFLEFSGISKAEQFLPVSLPSVLFSDVNLNNSVRIYVAYWQIKDLRQGVSEFSIGSDSYRLIKNDSLFLFFNHVDQNYYHYRKTLDLQTINQGNPFAEPVTVYSNVNNAFGVFAGYSVSRHEIDLNLLPKPTGD
jgi:hypothetical protein